jgi:transglutaminase-like putative cysteine protease
MPVKALRACVLFAAAWGLLSVTLTGEISPGWLSLGWCAWAFSLSPLARHPRIAARMRRLETPAVLVLLSLLAVDFLVFHSTLFLAITHFLLLFQSFKLVGPGERKDNLQIFLFAFFQALAACTLSVDAWNAVILLALIPTAIATLFWNQMSREWEISGAPPDAATQPHYRRLAVWMSALGLPIILVMTTGVFVIFPRLAFNASFPGLHARRMGYSDQLNLAQKGDLEENSAVVLWMSFPQSTGRPAWDGYIRGDVLSAFDGRQWSAAQDPTTRTLTADTKGLFIVAPGRPAGTLLHQRITLADASSATLFAIARPLRIIAPVHTLRVMEGGALHWDSLWRHPVRYDAFSDPTPIPEAAPAPLRLPPVSLERVHRLADRVAGQGPALTQAKNIEAFLQKNYRYSTDFGDRVPENPVDYFLFERRQGSCGHFASAMALMLRLRGIPSRVVAGFLAGEWNDPAQAIVVHGRDAHAWTEAYLSGQGWVTFDPTPTRRATTASHSLFLTRLKEYDDYLSLLWDQFVIQYDLYAQIRTLENVRSFSNRFASTWNVRWPAWRYSFRGRSGSVSHLPAIAWGLPLTLAVFGVLFWFQKSRSAGDPSIRFYILFLERMARAGHPRRPEETGWEYASRLTHQRPGDRADIAAITERYYRRRFAEPP